MDFAFAKRDWPVKVRAVEGEGMVLPALAARVHSCRQRFAEGAIERLAAMLYRQALGIDADGDGLETQVLELVVQFRRVAAPQRVAPFQPDVRQQSFPKGAQVF